MSKLIIHGRATSSNVQPVVWAATELGIDFERLDVGGPFGGNDEKAFRAISPMGLVPAIEDGDVKLFESPAILRYLAAIYGNEGFWPSEPGQRAELDQWAEWAKGTFSRAVTYDVFWLLVRTPSVQRNPDTLATNVANVGKLAKIADARIGKGPYLAGEKLSFADIMMGFALYRYYTLNFERADTPNLDAYYKRLTERPAYADHVMVDYSSMQLD